MKTNIVFDHKLIKKAQSITGIKNKSELINVALNIFILVNEQAKIKSLRGKVKWQGNLSRLRQSRIK